MRAGIVQQRFCGHFRLIEGTIPSLQVLPLTGDVQSIALELCEKYGIARQRYYDAQLAATMLVHGIRTLVTENDRDFADMTEIRAVNPFKA